MKRRKLKSNPYAALERLFHEPNRLAIMSVLCSASSEQSFTELKEACDLTDGNLSRHLKTLEEHKAVCIRKRFVKSRPRTTVRATEAGREGFLEYLQALEEVLQRAAESVLPEAEAEASIQNTLRVWSEESMLEAGGDLS
jgi:DNA-binding transcriptional ArsR family regulator